MSDTPDSTLSSTWAAFDALFPDGLPPLRSTPEADVRERAEDLAMALAYTWLNKDTAAQEEFLSEIVDLGDAGAGVMFAVDALTKVRLLGVPPGGLRPGVRIGTAWTVPASARTDEVDRWREPVEVVGDLWSGCATGDHAMVAKARGRLYSLPLQQVRDVLWIMAFDAGVAMETFAIWQAAGCDAWEDYRLANPPEDALPPAGPVR